MAVVGGGDGGSVVVVAVCGGESGGGKEISTLELNTVFKSHQVSTMAALKLYFLMILICNQLLPIFRASKD